METKVGPSILQGEGIILEPLRIGHVDDLTEAAKKVDWSWFLGPLLTREAVLKRVEEGLEAEEKGEAYAFAVRLAKDGGKVIGSTSYLSVNHKHRRLEIGSTWYSEPYQGTFVNPECKYLLLKHAFDEWGAVRVQFVTDINNVHSQRAIAKLGAKEEGTLRNYGIRADGTPRTVRIYSIIPQEWASIEPALRKRIEYLRV